MNKENSVLKTQIENLAAENAEQGAEIQALKGDNEAIRKENVEVKEMLKKLIKK